jgi:hypothetical protein
MKLSKAVKGFERAGLSEFEDPPNPRHPVRALPVSEMADDIVNRPCIIPFIAPGPRIRHVADKRIESFGRSAEKGDSIG